MLGFGAESRMRAASYGMVPPLPYPFFAELNQRAKAFSLLYWAGRTGTLFYLKRGECAVDVLITLFIFDDSIRMSV